MNRQIPLGLLLLLGACGGTATPPTAPDAEPVDPNTMPMGQTVTGEFRGTGGHRAAGSLRLTIANGVALLEFDAAFTTDGVPGPYVYLNTENNPNRGQPLRVAPLKARTGSQSYTFQVPAGVRYTYVLVWCDPFNVPVAEAPIPATP